MLTLHHTKAVRLLKEQHDPLRLATNHTDTLVWNGKAMTYQPAGNGFTAGYVWEDLPSPKGGDTCSAGHTGMDQADHRGWDVATHVKVPVTSWGDYHGDSATRSNYEALVRDYPDTFVEITYDFGGRALALPLDAAVDEHLLDTLIALRDDYPLYDDQHESALVMEMAWEAWDGYVKADLPRDLEKYGVDDDLIDQIDFEADGKGTIRDTFFTLTGEQPEYPRTEAGSATSVIFPYYDDTVEAIAKRLIKGVGEPTLIVREGIAAAHPWLRLPGILVPA